MTLTMLALAVVAGGAAFCLPTVLAWRRQQIEIMTVCRDEFYKAVEALLSDDATPEIVITRLDFLEHNMIEPGVGRYVAWSAITGELRQFAEHPSDEVKKSVAAIESMRPELQELFGRAMIAGVLAGTYTNMVIGPFLRRVLLFSVKVAAQQAELVASSMPARLIHHDDIRVAA